MGVRSLSVADLDLYRSLRLRALRTDPDAFGSSYEREVAFDDDTWRERLLGFAGRPGVILVDEAATDGDEHTPRVQGMTGIGQQEDPGDAAVWGMWVAPEARGSGSGNRLLDAALTWAADQGMGTMSLAVRRANGPAIALYRRFGFVEHDSIGLAADDPCIDELMMRCPVG